MAKIFKRGETWWARATRKGREYRVTLSTTSRQVAEKRFADWLAKLGAHSFGERIDRSFDEAATKFIDEHLPTISLEGETMSGDVVEKMVRAYWTRDGIDLTDINMMEDECENMRAAIKALAESVTEDMILAAASKLRACTREEVIAAIRAALLAAESGGR